MRLLLMAVCSVIALLYLREIKQNQIESFRIQKEILEQLQDTIKCDTIPYYETPDHANPFSTYEQALSAGIDKGLELLK